MSKRGEDLFIGLNDLREDFIEEANLGDKSQDKKKTIKNKWLAIGAVLFIFLLPNASPIFAHALADIPFIGGFFEVITFYKIDEINGESEIKIEGPKILSQQDLTSVEQVNDAVKTYIETSLVAFKEAHGQKQSSLDMAYEIVTDTDKWFSLRVYATEIGASGYESNKYYTIDKTSGKTLIFKELFKSFDLSKEKINKYLIGEMKRQMTADDSVVYFIQEIDHTGFQSVVEDQSYFVNEKGQVVIAFNEYEVAPGFMGPVQFVLPSYLYKE